MYTIFTIDFENNPFKMNIFNNWLAENGLVPFVKRMYGSYKGQKEHSFLCRRELFDREIRGTRFMLGQESILHVATGNKQEAELEYLATGETESIGCMHTVCKEEAEQAEAYTYDPQFGNYYIAKEGNPDDSYRRSVEQYRDNPVFDNSSAGQRIAAD